MSHYLDHAAATPLDERVFAAMEPYLKDQFYNPSAAYTAGREVRRAVDQARHQLAMVIGAKPSEIILTAGATESINLAIHGVMKTYAGNVLTAQIEHPAVLRAVEHYDAVYLEVDGKGQVLVDQLLSKIDDQTTLVSIGYANNELGTVQMMRAIADVIDETRQSRLARGIMHPIFFHTDASQAAGSLDLSVARLGVDLMTLNAGKCYGPKQIGLLWARPEVTLSPLIDGGGQERGLRSGTENVAGIVGFATALTIAHEARKEETYRLRKMRDELQRQLQAAFPDLIVNSHQKRRLPHHLHASLPGLDGERAVFALDIAGIQVATGSACAANKGTRSHVLNAVGMDEVLADGSLRISLGRDNDESDIAAIADAMISVITKERQL